MKKFTFTIICTLLFLLLISNTGFAQRLLECSLPKFGQISLEVDLELNGTGQNIDSIEFWKSPYSSETLMFVTAKGNNLVEVWEYPFEGNQISSLMHNTFQNSPVNGVTVDQNKNLLYVSIGNPSSTVSVFSLPDLNFLFNFNRAGANYHTEPNLALLTLNESNKKIYVSADSAVDIHNPETGEFLQTFTTLKALETMATDNFYQRIYIPDENDRTGVYLYNPDGTPLFLNGSNVFGETVFDADAEGIIIYTFPTNSPVDSGFGFIVVSDQKADVTDFEFFDRITLEHLGTLNIIGVSNTDGIASYPYPLTNYPYGIFAVINNDQTVVIVGWDSIFNQISNITGNKEINFYPPNYQLYQNYPNPFNPKTTIRYSIPNFIFSGVEESLVQLKVYDVLGNEIVTLFDELIPAGRYEVDFNASSLASGTYYYKIRSNDFVQTKKMLLIK